MVNKTQMQTVILAGGRGTRLSPITDNMPKPMVPVKGKPFLEYLLLMLKKNSLQKIILCVGYLGDKIEAYFGDGGRLGMEIKYSYEKELLGTGGALKLAAGLIEEKFLVLYGDSYLNIDYRAFIEFFDSQATTGAVIVYNNTLGDTKVRNNIAVEGSLVVRYDKTSADAHLKYVEAGVSIFKNNILEYIAENQVVSLENDIFPVLIKNRDLAAYLSNVRFCDIGTLDRLNNFNSSRFNL